MLIEVNAPSKIAFDALLRHEVKWAICDFYKNFLCCCMRQYEMEGLDKKNLKIIKSDLKKTIVSSEDLKKMNPAQKQATVVSQIKKIRETTETFTKFASHRYSQKYHSLFCRIDNYLEELEKEDPSLKIKNQVIKSSE